MQLSWTLTFQHAWKWQSDLYAELWGTSNISNAHDVRSDYRGDQIREDLVTDKPVQYTPISKRFLRQVRSTSYLEHACSYRLLVGFSYSLDYLDCYCASNHTDIRLCR